MMPPAVRHVAAWCVLVLAVVSGSACDAPPTDEDIIRRYISEGVAAINARDRAAAMAHVRPGMRIRRGGVLVDPDGLMLLYFHRYEQVHAFVYGVDVRVGEGRATATFDAILLGGNRRLPDNVNVFVVESQWEKEEDWLLTGVRWQRKTLALPELPPAVREWFEARE